MDLKSSAVLGASIVIASLILGVTFLQKPIAAPVSQAAPSVEVGRFQLGGVPSRAFVLDTATGEVWDQFVSEGSAENTSPDFKDTKLD